MARILIGWELGGNSGHTVKLLAIAAELVAGGHEPVFAVQQIGAMPPGHPLWQAPLWPAQLATLARIAGATPATMGDILAVLGLGEMVAMRGLIAAWDAILHATRPDLVLAEFAPGLMMAARGRVPVLGLGTGFSLPPPHLPRFASLTGRRAVEDEGRLLESVNGALRANGRAPLDHLPEIFSADRLLVAAFGETDPYREWRSEPHGAPSVTPVPMVADGSGDELFVYINGLKQWPNAFWQGLADAGCPVRVHAPRLSAADVAVLRRAGMAVEVEPVPFARIVARSRVVLSHGGLGFASSALLAGLPLVAVPFDIEKRMVAASIVELGLGRRIDHELVEAAGFTALLRETLADRALAARARAAAPGFRARLRRSSEDETVDEAEALLAG